ncbi:hypothetical protein J4206_01175 [Candidatus Woesearchaeota archaeon]|nr:hypothetical protein [Candidatus Woesearchaeota archaeon]
MGLEEEVGTSVRSNARVLADERKIPGIYNILMIDHSKSHRLWIEDLISAYYMPKEKGSEPTTRVYFGGSKYGQDLIVFYLTAKADAYATLEQIRKDNTETPILIISALPKSQLDRQKLRDAGIKRRDVLVERLDLGELWGRLREYCPR